MIMTVAELKQFVNTDLDDKILEAKLQAIELLIREYTNNNFQKRAYRKAANIVGGLFVANELIPFKVGDTVQICNSKWNEGLYTIAEVDDATFKVNEDVTDEDNVTVTKVEYPMDVKMGIVNMMQWDLENRAKVGVIQSETISRHSVTYASMDGDNSAMGYPTTVIGFLKAHKKARF